MGIEEVIDPHRTELLRLGRMFPVSSLWVFGSVCRREATEQSDVDFMVKWKHPVSLLTKAGLGVELERVLGRRVDLVTEGGLHWAISPQVEAERVRV